MHGPRLALIAALAENRVIGRAGRLPWYLPADLAHFKRLTLDKPILMGRRTWESLPGVLPRRRHIVLSRDPAYRVEAATLARSLDEAIVAAGEAPELMVIGGAALYAEALPRADRLYLTLVHAPVEGDVYFPAWDLEDWLETSRSEHPADGPNPTALTFLTLARTRGL